MVVQEVEVPAGKAVNFGQGIVRTPSNFGKLGTPPSHPELLDYLAQRFIDSGWSIKAMHRMMMLSSTYQMSSAADPKAALIDPENRLNGHANVNRLEAEAVRDNLLARFAACRLPGFG